MKSHQKEKPNQNVSFDPKTEEKKQVQNSYFSSKLVEPKEKKVEYQQDDFDDFDEEVSFSMEVDDF